ncbi:hypothetical protein WL80_32070 [Burkholderia ubonensis]|nr:hypothetical protein WJ60_18745 [Burkholderia ubonensis]KVX72106.1 hypothetical protein WL08_20470 [Burkholderia ubonensis]KVZ04310.1 hypothetical protein WL11_00140 [Burkholderia ubonensis]KWE99880.1 hypothetical protein WL80_32070 [Burkholderia ubonensis]
MGQAEDEWAFASASNRFLGDDCRNQWFCVFLGRVDVALTRWDEFPCIECEIDFPKQKWPRIALSYRIRVHFFDHDIHD